MKNIIYNFENYKACFFLGLYIIIMHLNTNYIQLNPYDEYFIILIFNLFFRGGFN